MLARLRPSEPSPRTTPNVAPTRRGGPAPPGPPIRAVTLPEVLLVPAALLLLLAIGLPVIAEGRRDADVQTSLNNLVSLGAAHAIYAADWNGRQVSVIVDDISSYGWTAGQAFDNYNEDNDEEHPPLYLGFGFSFDGSAFGLWRYRIHGGNVGLVQPIVFAPINGFVYRGFFRMMNTRPLHNYLSGRYYDPVFYPPGDCVPHDVVAPAYDLPSEWVKVPDIDQGMGDIPVWAGYCPSPAAYYHPDVMRHPDAGGWQDPWSINHGFETPGLYQALYPSLKTHMLEHHWIQNAPPVPCNPAFEPGTFAGCEPWYFNHGFESEPATLFYDLSTRLLPVSEALAADAQVMEETGYGLWSRDTPFGDDGYLSEYGYDATQTSFHVLTTDGILGRDTTAAAAGLAASGAGGHLAPAASPSSRRPGHGAAARRFRPGAGSFADEDQRFRMTVGDP